jgi:hypothetical protein
VEMLAREPFEIHVRYELEDRPDGHSMVRIRTSGGGSGFFRMAAPLLAKMVRRSITNDLENLKAYLED